MFEGVRDYNILGTTALDNSTPLTLWQQFGEGPFLFQHDNALVNKARSIQKSIQNLTGLHRALTSTPSKVPDLTNALVAEWKQVPAAMFQHLVESLPRRGTCFHINAHDCEVRYSTSRCPHTFGHVM
jgi:hypothetical protein